MDVCYVLLTLLIYNLVPLLNLLVPESRLYFLTDPWIVNPIYAMAAPADHGGSARFPPSPALSDGRLLSPPC